LLKVKTKLKFLFRESFFGGSLREFARGLVSHSKHRIDLVTMPARFWKWRMHGGAVTLARRFLDAGALPDVILATDMR